MLEKIIPYVRPNVQQTHERTNLLNTYREGWNTLLKQLRKRTALAEAMGGADKIKTQHEKGRLNARERILALCDDASFNEYGALAGGNHPGGQEPLRGRWPRRGHSAHRRPQLRW